MFRVIASDLDGTLLTSKNQLTSFTKDVLRLLTTVKVHFVFATGRHYTNVVEIRNSLEISAYMITSNGSRIYDTEDKLIASYDLDGEIVYDLLCIVHHDPKIITNIFQSDKWLSNRHQCNQERFLKESNLGYEIYHRSTLSFDGISKVYFTSSDYGKLLLLEEKLNKRWGYRINVSFSFPTCLEVISGGISKGYALQKVVNLLGFQMKDCISFGDGMNDQEMLSMTGKGCIMYNAHQRLKDALPFLEVIGSNEEEAVPHYLKYMYFY